MKIFYEQSMPYAAEFFQDWGQCEAFNGKTLTAEQLADADLLFVRSTTQVNQGLLSKAQKLKFVATATAGTDHLDTEYLTQRGIGWASAAGCNAVAVAEYVLSALFVMAERLNWCLTDKKVGIVGAGHVGTALSQKLAALNINYLLCDPPLAEQGDSRDFVSLDEVIGCDVISLHVPWIKQGPYKTDGFIDAQKIQALSEQQLLINACRGEVIDEAALLQRCKAGHKLNLVLDVWHNEPDINLELLPYTQLATAHIAGHTNEGKARGTEMVYQAAAEFLSLPVTKSLNQFLPAADISQVSVEGPVNLDIIKKIVLLQYDIRRDDSLFRTTVSQPGQFEYIRQHYIMRRELSALKVRAGNCDKTQAIYGLGCQKSA